MLLALMAAVCLAEEPIEAGGANPAGAQGPIPKEVGFYGYLDVGWFDAAGDGVAYRRDPGNISHGTSAAWVFHGDPWANPVNSLGESADMGLGITTLDRSDPIASAGRPTALVNVMYLGMVASPSKRLAVRSALGVTPRPGNLGALGDVVFLDHAYLEWRPLDRSDLRLSAGKVESVFGIEYRQRQSPARYGVTPSLVARYTTGTPTGIRARGSFRRILWVAAALTNGGMTQERFGHLSDELDTNGVPTASGRVALATTGVPRLEVGASGSVGPQDGQPYIDVVSSQIGADLMAELSVLELRAEALRSRHPGVDDSEQLDATGWYVELSGQLTPWLRPVVRVGRRDAVLLAQPNLYLSDVLRLTAGARVDLSYSAMVKVEWLHLDELGSEELQDDVVTSSAVIRF